LVWQSPASAPKFGTVPRTTSTPGSTVIRPDWLTVPAPSTNARAGSPPRFVEFTAVPFAARNALGALPCKKFAFRFFTSFDEFTESGGLLLATVIPMPVAPAPALVLVTWSCFPALAPVSVVVALTLFVLPRLNTPPTPVPATAADDNNKPTDTTDPKMTPFTKVAFTVPASTRRAFAAATAERNDSTKPTERQD